MFLTYDFQISSKVTGRVAHENNTAACAAFKSRYVYHMFLLKCARLDVTLISHLSCFSFTMDYNVSHPCPVLMYPQHCTEQSPL